MHIPLLPTTPTVAVVVGLTIGLLVTSATALYAADVDADGTHVRSKWLNGGDAVLELEDRNNKPLICFAWVNDGPQDGDSIASRILTRSGTVAVAPVGRHRRRG